MKALILLETNKVVEVRNDVFDVNNSLIWHDCDESVTTDHYYIDGKFKETNLSDEEYLQILKNEKHQQIKDLRDNTIGEPTPKDGSAISYKINGEDVVFEIAFRDLPVIVSIIDLLRRRKKANIKPFTRAWSDANGVRRELDEELFQSLHDHILDRDNTQRSLCVQRKNAINALTSADDIRNYDINTIYEI